jgi:hypoxanthine-DNA glycosylase
LSATELRTVLTGLPPLIDERSRVLVLGSFPSRLSLDKREYYGNPQNHFWQIMSELFAFDVSAPYAERTGVLLANSVAVWDVIAECSREGSGDDAIQDATANPLLRLLHDYPKVRHIAFNGGTALRAARSFVPDLFADDCVEWQRLPSTSPRHARLKPEAKLAAWRQLTEWRSPE